MTLKDEAATPAGPREVLVVDDDKVLKDLVVDELQVAGYAAYGASDAHEAVKLLETRRPSLILLDIDMPGFSGLELLRRLKNSAVTANTPVVMFSGQNRREIVVDALREGAADFIAKPFKRELLLRKLETVLERCAQAAAAAQSAWSVPGR